MEQREIIPGVGDDINRAEIEPPVTIPFIVSKPVLTAHFQIGK